MRRHDAHTEIAANGRSARPEQISSSVSRVTLCSLCLCVATLAHAAVTGTVTNQTTGKPEAGATVLLFKLGGDIGIEEVAQTKTDAAGKFAIDQTPQGPHLIRTAAGGVTYSRMIQPGQPTTGVELSVFDSSKQPGAAKVDKHMIMLEPASGQIAVTETYLFTNTGKATWNDPENGTLRFALPEGAGKPDVKATAPGGMPLDAPAKRIAKSDIWAVDFAIKPGDTRIDVAYTRPFTEGADVTGKIASKDDNTYLVVPNGVELKGEGLNDLGAEPRTQAHIYGLAGNAYKVQLSGAAAAPPADQGGDDADQRIDQIMPRVNTQTVPIVASALGVLALGFAILYRQKAPAPRGGPRG
jgi:hypothetical protein